MKNKFKISSSKFKVIGTLILTLLTFNFALLALPGSVNAQSSCTPGSGATLALSPASGTFNRGCNVSIQINVNAGNTQCGVDGVDAILLYNPAQFNALSITNGSIFPDYPGNVTDNTTNPAKVSISGLASVSSAFKGSGTLATVNFQIPQNATPGQAAINFDFDPNQKDKTTDSNVVERQTVLDILGSVTNGNYTIGTGTTCSGTTSGAGATGVGGTTLAGNNPTGGTFAGNSGVGSGTAQPKVLPSAGVNAPTLILAGFGIILVVLGIIGVSAL